MTLVFTREVGANAEEVLMAAKKKTKIDSTASADNESPLSATFEEAVAKLEPDWPDPQLEGLERPKSSMPIFPTAALPPSIETIVDGIASAQKMPAAYIGPAVIAGLSGAVGNRVRISMGPGLAEPVSIYVVLTGPPASGKSTCIRVAANALSAVERGNEDEKPMDAMANRIGQNIAAKRRNKALHAILSNGSTPVMEPNDRLKEFQRRSRSLVISEATAAGLVNAMRQDALGRILISYEFAGVIRGAINGQGLRGRTLILDAHDGVRHVLELKSEGQVVVDNLQLSLLGAVQTDRVKDVVGRERDGLQSRILWADHDAVFLNELPEGAGPIEELRTLYEGAVRIGEDTNHKPPFALIELTDKAHKRLAEVNQSINAEIACTDSLVRDAYARGCQQVRRLAGLFAVAESVASGSVSIGPVGPEIIDRAATLVLTFFMPVAESLFSKSAVVRETEAESLFKYLQRLGKQRINVRTDIQRGHGSPFRDKATIDTIMEELRLRGLTRQSVHAHDRPGRSPGDWDIHPAIVTRRKG
jgi:Protein of unknown function (DUF3987)